MTTSNAFRYFRAWRDEICFEFLVSEFTQERKDCDMEVEIVTFVIKGSAQLTVPPDRQEEIQVGSRGVALNRVFYLKLSGRHLAKIILKIWIIDWHYVIDVSMCEVELRC